MKRRTFLQTASTLAVAATLPGARSAAPSGSARKMTIALTPGSIGVTVQSQQQLNDLAHRHRFESVEPRGEEIAGMSPEQISATLADLKTK